MSTNEGPDAPLWALTRLEAENLFEQGLVWADIAGVRHPIRTMSTAYVIHVLMVLRERNQEPDTRALLFVTPLWMALERELASRD